MIMIGGRPLSQTPCVTLAPPDDRKGRAEQAGGECPRVRASGADAPGWAGRLDGTRAGAVQRVAPRLSYPGAARRWGVERAPAGAALRGEHARAG